ncbi:MAG: NADH-quinone oxidoreductase subunit J [Alphaproteobacteria bacterium]|nr:NADH-quinone oxidoreductase subunit J [Alphaproteobacteria bacterium]MCL2505048.1 NADH-quinone oxidoreductase subunit J [Alphaproteobacteria bacterium]
MFSAIMFYIYSAILLTSAGMVVCSKNLVHALLFLILCFVNVACLFILIGAEFLAFILIIIYAGAIAILFLFVIMMLDIGFKKQLKKEWKTYLPMAIVVCLVLLVELIMTDISFDPGTFIAEGAVSAESQVSNTHAMGQVLYTKYFLPFQVCGLILLTAMIGAIVLNLRERKQRKMQSPMEQTNVSVSDVIRITSVISKNGVQL